MEIKKGQKVWVDIFHLGIRETTVKSVGHKYITLDYNPRCRFNKDDLRETNYCGIASRIILDIEEYNKDIYYGKLIAKFRNYSWKKLKREDLDKVLEILKKYE